MARVPTSHSVDPCSNPSRHIIQQYSTVAMLPQLLDNEKLKSESMNRKFENIQLLYDEKVKK